MAIVLGNACWPRLDKWFAIFLITKESLCTEELFFVDSRMPLLPKYFDFIDAAEGIRKMQATYQMFSSDIAKGLLDGVQYK